MSSVINSRKYYSSVILNLSSAIASLNSHPLYTENEILSFLQHFMKHITLDKKSSPLNL
jgi:hypothetical protein